MNTTPAPTRLRDVTVGRTDLHMIDPRRITIEPGHNPRDYTLPENRDHLDQLKISISSVGVKKALLVRWEPSTKEVILVDGECRLRACLELIAEGVDVKSVPCIQVQGNNEVDRLLTALIANTGKPLSKWESGNAYRRLAAFGWTTEQIAEKTGEPVRYIREAIELDDAPEEVKQQLSRKAVTPALALKHVRKYGSQAGKTLSEEIRKATATGKRVAKAPRAQNAGAVCRAASHLLRDVTAIEWQEDDKYVSVSKFKLMKLASACGFEIAQHAHAEE